MLHTILVILKVAGIIIAAILALILLILLGILFIPVRYSSSGELNNKILLSVNWLAHIISFKLSYDTGQVAYSFRIFGINIFGSNKKKKPDKPVKNKNKKKESKKLEQTKITETKETQEAQQVQETKNTKSEHIKSKHKKTLKHSIKAFFDAIKNTVLKVKSTLKKIQETVKFMQDDTTKAALSCIKENVIYLLKHYLPRKISMSLKFGFDSPDITGRVLGWLSVLYAILGKRAKNLNVIPDFDNKVIEGNYNLRGRIRLWHLLIAVLKLLLKREVRISYKRLKKEN